MSGEIANFDKISETGVVSAFNENLKGTYCLHVQRMTQLKIKQISIMSTFKIKQHCLHVQRMTLLKNPIQMINKYQTKTNSFLGTKVNLFRMKNNNSETNQ